MTLKPYSPLPWHADEIGRNSVNNPVCVVRDAGGHAVAEYLAQEDADMIVACVNAEMFPDPSQAQRYVLQAIERRMQEHEQVVGNPENAVSMRRRAQSKFGEAKIIYDIVMAAYVREAT